MSRLGFVVALVALPSAALAQKQGVPPTGEIKPPCLARDPNAPVAAVDPFGYPLREIAVDLTPGRTWELRTDLALTPVPGAPFADSVLAVGPANGPSTAAADGCATAGNGFAWEPSCLSIAVPAGASPAHTVRLRAARAWTAGQTTVWKRDVTNPASPGPLTPITSGKITFGGALATVSTGAGGASIDTWRRPGKNQQHAVWLLGADGISITSVHGGDPVLFDTVRALLPCGPQQVVYGGTMGDEVGPVGVVQLGLDDADDWDGDGLDLAQERAQGICDRPTQGALASGFRCDERIGCGALDTYAEGLCKASLRDTDHDGLGDYVELRGIAGDYPADFPSLDLPAMGVSPAHMDVLIEVDASDQDPSTAMWDGFDAATIQRMGNTGTFFAEVQRAYSGAPARLNPDGLPGIALHWDVGVANEDVATRTIWNDWGGGNSTVIATCNREEAWSNLTSTTLADGTVQLECYWPDMFVDERKGVFIYAVDGAPGTGGQASSWLGVYGADDTDVHVHELGHCGLLEHEGPPGSAAAAGPSGNTRVNYLSRINYLFQSAFVGSTRWGDIKFSDGLAAPMPGASLSELAVLPTAIADVLDALGFRTRVSATRPGWSDIDWTDDTTYAGAGTSAWVMRERMTRDYVLRGRQANRTVPELARVGNGSLVMAHGVQAPGGDTLVLRVDRDGDCEVLPQRWSRSDPPDAFGARGPYPGCFRPGSEAQVITGATGAPSVADAVVVAAPYDGTTVGSEALVMWRNGSAMRWGTYRPEATTGRYTYGGVLSQFAVKAGWDRPLDLTAVPGTGDLRFVYIDTEHRLVQATRQSGTWGPLRFPVPSWGSTPVAVDLAELDGVIYAVTAELAGTLRLWRVPADDTQPWIAVADLPGLSIMPWDGVSMARTRSTKRDDTRPSRLVIHYRNAGRNDGAVWETAGRLMGVEFVPSTGSSFISGGNITTEVNRVPGLGKDGPSGGPSGGVTSTAGRTGAWGDPFFFMDNNNEARGHGVADTLWDDRPSLAPSLHGLRMVNTVGEIGAQDCEAGTYHRGAGTRYHCADPTDDAPVMRVDLYPFADGVDPTVYADYDDWIGLQWGFCRALAVHSADPCRCGPMPSFPEPVSDGHGGVTMDPTFHPREWPDGCDAASL